jgi:hypothetical protein
MTPARDKAKRRSQTSVFIVPWSINRSQENWLRSGVLCISHIRL